MTEMIFVDAHRPEPQRPAIDPRIVVGSAVRRKRGTPNIGVVARIVTRDMTRCREWGWCPAAPHEVAVVRWSTAVRWLGGKSDWTSKVRLDTLVLNEPAPPAGKG